MFNFMVKNGLIVEIHERSKGKTPTQYKNLMSTIVFKDENTVQSR